MVSPAEVSVPARGQHRDPVLRDSVVSRVAVVVLALIGAAVVLFPVWQGLIDSPTAPLLVWMLPALIGGAALLAALAGARFVFFVLVVLAIRPALDFYGRGAIGFGTLLGATFLALTSVWLLSQILTRRRMLSGYPLAVAALVMALSGILSTALSDDRATSLPELLRLFVVLAMFVVLERLLRDSANQPRVLLALAVSTVAPLIVGSLQLLQLGLGGDNRQLVENRVNATFSHPNSLAMYAALLLVTGLALFPALPRVWRMVGVALLAGLALLLLGTATRAAWIGAAFGILVVTWLTRRRLAVIALAGIAGIAMTPAVRGRFADVFDRKSAEFNAFVGENSLEWRIGHWQRAIDVSAPRRATGLGPGIVEAQSVGHKPMHNDYLRAWVEFGGVGVLAYVFLFGTMIAIVVFAWRRVRTGTERAVVLAAAGAIGVALVMALTDNLLTQSVVLWYLAPSVAAASAIAARPPGDPLPTDPQPVEESASDPLALVPHSSGEVSA